MVLLQKELQIQEFLEGNRNVPVGCSFLKLNKPSVDDLNRQFPLGNLSCSIKLHCLMLQVVETALVFMAL